MVNEMGEGYGLRNRLRMVERLMKEVSVRNVIVLQNQRFECDKTNGGQKRHHNSVAAQSGAAVFTNRLVVQKLINQTRFSDLGSTIVRRRRELTHVAAIRIGRVVRIIADTRWWSYRYRIAGIRRITKDLIRVNGYWVVLIWTVA